MKWLSITASLDTKIILEVAVLVLSVISLIISLINFQRNRKCNSYIEIDKEYSSLLNIAINNPNFRDSKVTGQYEKYKKADYELYMKYSTYAYMMWNFLETVYDISAKKHFKHKDRTWDPVISEEKTLHYSWFKKNERLFGREFVRYITNFKILKD